MNQDKKYKFEIGEGKFDTVNTDNSFSAYWIMQTYYPHDNIRLFTITK